jgi:hypothetical protein
LIFPTLKYYHRLKKHSSFWEICKNQFDEPIIISKSYMGNCAKSTEAMADNTLATNFRNYCFNYR